MIELEIVEYLDPHCTWSWGHEATVTRVREQFGEQVRVVRKMGGLIENIRHFANPRSGVTADNWHRAVAKQWQLAAAEHQMPVEPSVLADIQSDFVSTFPASLAFKAAQQQGDCLAEQFLRLLLEGGACGGLAIHRRPVQRHLAERVGLDVAAWENDLNQPEVVEAFEEERREIRELGFRMFPVFVLKTPGGQSQIVDGYQKGEVDLETPCRLFLGDDWVPAQPILNTANLVQLLRRRERITLRECSVVFGVDRDTMAQRLEACLARGEVRAGPCSEIYLSQKEASQWNS